MLTSIGARIAGALVDVGLAVLAGESGDAVARVTVDSVDAGGTIAARIAETFVDVVLAVASRRARLTTTLVTADEVLAMSAKLTGIRFALVDLRLAKETVVARMTLASEGIDSVDAIAVVARRALAVVDVDFAIESGESLRAVAGVKGNRVAANTAVLTGSTEAVVDIDVTLFAGEARRTDALVAIDHARADAAVDARVRCAFIYVQFAVDSGETYGEKREIRLANNFPIRHPDGESHPSRQKGQRRKSRRGMQWYRTLWLG